MVSRDPLCCWWAHLRGVVEAFLIAPPPAASGGRKSRKYEPLRCCEREAQVRRTLRSLNRARDCNVQMSKHLWHYSVQVTRSEQLCVQNVFSFKEPKQNALFSCFHSFVWAVACHGNIFYDLYFFVAIYLTHLWDCILNTEQMVPR